MGKYCSRLNNGILLWRLEGGKNRENFKKRSHHRENTYTYTWKCLKKKKNIFFILTIVYGWNLILNVLLLVTQFGRVYHQKFAHNFTKIKRSKINFSIIKLIISIAGTLTSYRILLRIFLMWHCEVAANANKIFAHTSARKTVK